MENVAEYCVSDHKSKIHILRKEIDMANNLQID